MFSRIIGNQVGSGRGNTAATAIGAVGGAVAGNEIEKRVKTGKSYEACLRRSCTVLAFIGRTAPVRAAAFVAS